MNWFLSLWWIKGDIFKLEEYEIDICTTSVEWITS